ncbi:hypothetical protein H9I45_15810 [Polaribacter haliotis]|uniref:Uncharacterized protein n=2 Tax=Polaribacter haliotis TaxID=1888915 RepID=A0A7L8AKL3_9FLAO|nr:hypothetical protein [Polaribacter haliotis]QOD62517.1 hypothetical protein H9I45_15810 [Polaribacter haliotis]
MKNLFLLFAFSYAGLVFSQQEPEFPKYNAKNVANIFYYNLSEIPEKIKVKKEITKNKTLTELRKYNDKIKKISFLNTPKLLDLELTINSLGKQLYSNRELAEKISKRIQTIIVPIRDSIDIYEKTLNENLEGFLSKKQNKKWLKYQRAEKRKLLPERPKNQNSAPVNMNRRRRNGQGIGGRRF